MTQYNDTRGVSDQIRYLQEQIRALQTQPRLVSSSIDRGGTQSSDYDGTGINDPGTKGWKIGTDELTGVGYVHMGGEHSSVAYTPTPVAYSAGWEDYTAGDFADATWALDSSGYIHLEGAVMRSGATISGAASGTIFTLPPGARPAQDLLISALVGTTNVRFNLTSLGVFSAPSISIVSGTGGFISLNSITFRPA